MKQPHVPPRVIGWLSLAAGLVVGMVGVVMAWDARLHNAIVANRVENPWPGYVLAAAGIGLVVGGIVIIARAGRLAAPLTLGDR